MCITVLFSFSFRCFCRFDYGVVILLDCRHPVQTPDQRLIMQQAAVRSSTTSWPNSSFLPKSSSMAPSTLFSVPHSLPPSPPHVSSTSYFCRWFGPHLHVFDDCDALAHALHRHFVTAPRVASLFRQQMLAAEEKQGDSRVSEDQKVHQRAVKEQGSKEIAQRDRGKRIVVRESVVGKESQKTPREERMIIRERGKEDASIKGGGPVKVSCQERSFTSACFSEAEVCLEREEAQILFNQEANRVGQANERAHVLERPSQKAARNLPIRYTENHKIKRVEEIVEVCPGHDTHDRDDAGLCLPPVRHIARTDGGERISSRGGSSVGEAFDESCQDGFPRIFEQEECRSGDERRDKKQAHEQEEESEDKIELRNVSGVLVTHRDLDSREGGSSTGDNVPSCRRGCPLEGGGAEEENAVKHVHSFTHRRTPYFQENRAAGIERTYTTNEGRDQWRVPPSRGDDHFQQPDLENIPCFSSGQSITNGRSSQEEQEELEDILAAV